MPLLLAAPKIAGLLPARVGTPEPPVTFSHENPGFAALPESTRAKLFEAVAGLLDAAAECLLTGADEVILLHAEALVRNAVLGEGSMPPRARQKRADRHAAVRDYLAGSEARMAARYAEIEADVEAMSQAYGIPRRAVRHD